MYTLEELEALAEHGEPALDACLLPIEAGLADFPAVTLDAAEAESLGHGQQLRPAMVPPIGPVAVYDATGRMLGLARVDASGLLHPQRLFTWATPHAG